MSDPQFREFVANHFEERDREAKETRDLVEKLIAAVAENTRITTENNAKMSTIFAVMTFSENSARWTVKAGRIISHVAKVLIPIVALAAMVSALTHGEWPKLKDFF